MKRTDKISHRKASIDQDVALALGLKQTKVSLITSEFLKQMMVHLLDMDIVHLDGFGELQVVVQKGPGHTTLHAGNFKPMESRPMEVFVHRKYYVVFKKAAPFKEAIRARYGRAAEVEKKDGKVRRR